MAAIEIIRAEGAPELIEVARGLFTEYALELGIDLSFQDFATEITTLPGLYSAPAGRILVVRHGPHFIGAAAIRPLDPTVAEMKRLFVRPSARGLGAGRRLLEAAIAEGRSIGYRAIRLDTLPTMTAAMNLYGQLGFQPIEPYRSNPVEGARFLELIL